MQGGSLSGVGGGAGGGAGDMNTSMLGEISLQAMEGVRQAILAWRVEGRKFDVARDELEQAEVTDVLEQETKKEKNE